MFHPSPMDRVEVLVLNSDLPQLGRALGRAGILHLRPVGKSQLGRAVAAGEEPSPEKLSAFSDELDELRRSLGLPQTPGPGDVPLVEFGIWREWTAALTHRVRRVLARKDEVSRRVRELEQLEAFLKPLKDADGAFSELTALRHVSLIVGVLPAAAEAKLRPQRIPGSVHFLLRSPRETALLIVTTRRKAQNVHRLLGDLDFDPTPLPGRLAGSFETALEKVRRVRSRLSHHATILDARLAGLREEHRSMLDDRRRAVLAELTLRQAENSFGFTRRTVLLDGWLPRRRYRQLRGLLDEVCPGRYQMRRARARGDETPVELANPRLLRPFQKILNIFGTPLYGEVEPTPLLAFGFLLLFGMMFGDLGQGLVLFVLGLGMRRFSRFREEGLLLAELGVAAAVFGVLFGSVFGLETLLPALWFSPFQNVPLLMGAALAVGIALIFFGLLLRIGNLWGEVPLLELLTDRYGIAGAVFYGGAVGTILLVWGDLIPGVAVLWLLLPLAATFFHPLVTAKSTGGNLPMLLAEGIIEIMETALTYLVNTFSFLRVGAFGLAHVGLFMAVFAIADLVQNLPLGPLWRVLVILLGNLVILALEGLVVSIQAIRLQFYEFFTKFFQGGGVPYRPLTLGFAMERRK